MKRGKDEEDKGGRRGVGGNKEKRSQGKPKNVRKRK